MIPRPVPDPDGLRPLVPQEVVELELGDLLLASDLWEKQEDRRRVENGLGLEREEGRALAPTPSGRA